MFNQNEQSKVNKVDATQEMITAQNSNNQSKKLFGTFTEGEFRNVVENSGQDFIKANFVINYLKQAEQILDKARMSQENKNFIKGAFQMMVSFGEWNTKERYEFILQNDSPEEIRDMLEEGDTEGATECLEYEMGCIINDLDNEENYTYPEDELENAKEALEEFYDIIQEYELEDNLDSWTINEAYRIINE